MGRPLSKKYFGNRNVGTTGTGDDYGIGGQGLASISTATVGSFVVNDTYQNFPALTIGAPNLPTGVQATADVVFEIDTVTYVSGGQTDGDYVAGLSTSITGLGGGAVVRIVETANKVTSVDLVGGNRGEFRRGDFTGAGITTHQVLQAPNAGTDLQISVTFRVKSITILEKGSGYVSAPALSWTGHTFTGQTTPSGQTVTLTTDTGTTIGVTANQENAVRITAYIPTSSQAGYISGAGGSSAVEGDIIRQCGSDKYVVRTAQGVGRVTLKTTAASAAGEANITAVDYSGKTYYVTKLTAHKARITPYGATGHEFPLVGGVGQVVPWTFDTLVLADTGVRVKVNNA